LLDSLLQEIIFVATMCSSQEELLCSLSGPALGTRKRSVTSTFTFDDMLEGQEAEDMGEGGSKNISDSDDDFVIEKKKKVKTSKVKKLKGLNKSTSSSKSDGSTPGRSENSQVTIEVQLKEETSTNPKEDYQCNPALERPVIIATPEQINSRSFEQEEIMTPSSCSKPMEEIATFSSSNIVKNLVEQVVQAHASPVSVVVPSINPSEEMNTLPLKPSSSQLAKSTPSLSHHPNVTNSQVALGRGRGFRPANPLRPPVQVRQPAPGPRHSLRPSGPRMLRPLRPNHQKNKVISQLTLRPGGPTGGYRQPNIRSATPIKRRSLSTPQYSSQCPPPVVDLDDSPPRPDQDLGAFLPPTTNSVVNKLTSLGVSVAIERVPPTNPGWGLPPGLSITRASSTGRDESPICSLTSLANTLLQLGEVQGRTRLVQYQLSESQVMALQALGLMEIGV